MLKQMLCALIISGTILSGSVYAQSPYMYLPETHPAYNAVCALTSENIFYPSEDFHPDSYISRSLAAVILCNLTDIPAEVNDGMEESIFSDVPSDQWAKNYICWAYEHKLVNGFEDGTFRPEEYVTYEQFVKMLVCYMDLEEYAVKLGGYPNGYMQIASENHLMDEINFENSGALTCGDMAIMTYRAMKCAGYQFKETQE